MGPLFSLILIAIASSALFAVVFAALKIFVPTIDALRRAGGFVVGMASGAVMAVGLLALAFGTGASLTTKTQVFAYLATVASGALAGGAALSYFVSRKFR